MEQADLEGTADFLYTLAGLDSDAPASPLQLATKILGVGSVRRVHCLRTPAALARVGSDWRVYLQPRLSPRAVAWLVAHELAEWSLMHDGYQGEDIETVADRLAACIRAPRRAVLSAIRAGAGAIPDVAAAFRTSESSAALRYSEITGEPLALIAPGGSLRLRGDEWAWPSPSGIRKAARELGEPLGDAPKRRVLLGRRLAAADAAVV